MMTYPLKFLARFFHDFIINPMQMLPLGNGILVYIPFESLVSGTYSRQASDTNTIVPYPSTTKKILFAGSYSNIFPLYLKKWLRIIHYH